MELLTSIEFLGLFVAAVALVIGVWHLWEIRSQAKEIREQARGLQAQAKLSEEHKDMLDLILRGLPTHHIGQFPEYITPIADIIEKATKEVVILCDFPAYGCFSAPHDFLRYRQTLERKMDEGKTVRVTCLNAEARVSLTREQFSLELKQWEKWKKQPKNHQRLIAFLRFHESNASASNVTVEQFADLLEREDRRMLDQSLLSADVQQVNAHVPLYVWVVDGAKAVFSIPSFSEKATEHGFHTMDPHLINGLLDLEDRYRRIASPESSSEAGTERTLAQRG